MFDFNKIEEYFPGAGNLMIPPMLIFAGTKAKVQEAAQSGEYFGQEKIDGAYYQYVKTENNGSYLFGRTVSKKNGLLTEKSANVPHIMSAIDIVAPPNTIIIGEIYYPNKSSKDVVSIMGCLSDKAIERQNGEYGLIYYYVYDILMYNGIDFIKTGVNNLTRYKILEKIIQPIISKKQFYYISLAKNYYNDLEEKICKILNNGGEGMVLKKKDGLYQPGKRPQYNLKVKKVDYFDAVIINFKLPTKEYYGKDISNWEYWIDTEGNILSIGLHCDEHNTIPVTKAWYMGWENSRIVIGAYNNAGDCIPIGTIHSGISDELKKDMSHNPNKYLGKVCEIQAMEVDNKEHTIRHGFLVKIRNDKNAEECVIEEIFKK